MNSMMKNKFSLQIAVMAKKARMIKKNRINQIQK